jgi:predicted transcriptional regulator
MKPKKTLFIRFTSLDQLEKDLLDIPKTKKGYIQPKNEIQFDSVNSFRNFLTIQKLEILTLIVAAKPKSIYELTKMLDRNLAAVQSDCRALEGVGFIKFQKQSDGRKTVVPKLKFDYNRIVVQLPEHPYELQFGAAA